MNLGDLIQDIAQRFDAARLSYGHGTDNSWDEAVYLALTVTGFADHQQELVREVGCCGFAACTDVSPASHQRAAAFGVFAWALSVHGLRI